MTFFNKNQEVVDLKLTRFGKNLLSRGAFKPAYYQFFDDDIIYDASRIGVSEDQNDSETRIKEGVRLRTQHLAVSVESSFDYQNELIENEQRGVFLELRKKMDPQEEEKILKYPLATYSPGAQLAPSFSMEVLDSPLTGSLSFNTDNGLMKNIPQLTIEPEYIYFINRKDQTESGHADMVDPEIFRDLTSEIIEFSDKSKIILEKKDIVINLEEFSSFFGLHNFEVELFEETIEGSDLYVQILDREEILQYFNITTDEEAVTSTDPDYERNRNFYSR